MLSMHFMSCTSQHKSVVSGTSIRVCNCTFNESKNDSYNIVIDNYFSKRRKKLNILISNSTFMNSNGAIISSHNDLTILDTVFMNCRRKDKGGAIYTSAADLKIERCSFINNLATSGGAIYSSSSSVLLVSTKFEENYATESGSAIYSDMNVDSCWFRKNSAHSCGAVYATAIEVVLTINNTKLEDQGVQFTLSSLI